MSQLQLTVGSGYGGVGTSQLILSALANISTQGEFASFLIENPNSPAYVQEVKLTGTQDATPDNLILIPGGLTNKVSSVIIIPDPEADFQAILKAINTAADSEGFKLAKRAPSLLSFETPALPDGTNAQFYLKWGGVGLNRQATGTVDITVGNDYITVLNSTSTKLPVNTRVYFESLTDGMLPGGLVEDVMYYIVSSTNSGSDVRIKVALSKGGTVIDLTSAGSNFVVSTADTFRLVWL